MKKNKTKKGFALMYAVIIISIVSVIAFGLANITYKQKILSSLATDSQVAFYMADAGMECALFRKNMIMTNSDFDCFSIDVNNFGRLERMTRNTSVMPRNLWQTQAKKESCYSAEYVMPGVPPVNPRPSFIVRGYNTCQQNQNRFVERTLRAYF